MMTVHAHNTAVFAGSSIVDFVEQSTFPVALETFHAVTQLRAVRGAEGFHIGQRGVPVLRRFAGAQQVEVGAVEDVDGFHGTVFEGLWPRA